MDDVVKIVLRYHMLGLEDRIDVIRLYVAGFSPAHIATLTNKKRQFVAALLNRFPHRPSLEKELAVTLMAIKELRPPILMRQVDGKWVCVVCGRVFTDIMQASCHMVRHEVFSDWLRRVLEFVRRRISEELVVGG